MPVEQWIWALVAYDTAELYCLRDAVIGLRAADQVDSLRMDTRVTSDAEHSDAFALELLPRIEAAERTDAKEAT